MTAAKALRSRVALVLKTVHPSSVDLDPCYPLPLILGSIEVAPTGSKMPRTELPVALCATGGGGGRWGAEGVRSKSVPCRPGRSGADVSGRSDRLR